MEEYLRDLEEWYRNEDSIKQFTVCNIVQSGGEFQLETVFQYCVNEEEIDCVLPDIEPVQTSEDELDSTNIIHLFPNDMYLGKSGINENKYGVWSSREISKGVRFGPYEGSIILDEGKKGQSKGCSQGKEVISFSVGIKSEDQPNWLSYINFASCRGQENLLILKLHGQIYYETIKKILPGVELLAWYYADGAVMEGNDNDDKSHNENYSAGTEDEIKYNVKNEFSASCLQEGYGRTNVYGAYKQQSDIAALTADLKKQQPDFKKRKHIYKKMFENTSKLKTYVCNLCGERFMSVITLKYHQSQHEEKPYSCDLCEKRFTTTSSLLQHRYVHKEDKRYQCKFCRKRFSTKIWLNKHENAHTEKKFCDGMQDIKASAKHRECTEEKLYGCNLCEKRFSHYRYKRTHQLVHTGEKRYACNLCSKRYRSCQSLKIHQHVHIGEKPYSCNLCVKKFTTSYNLNIHQLIHTGEKPYPCGICGKQFRASRSLKTHQYIHTGVKPYSCNLCDKKFTTSRNVKGHKCVGKRKAKYLKDFQGLTTPNTAAVYARENIV